MGPLEINEYNRFRVYERGYHRQHDKRRIPTPFAGALAQENRGKLPGLSQ